MIPRRRAAIAQFAAVAGSVLTTIVGVLSIRASLAESEKGTLEAARQLAAWMARSEEHDHQCTAGIERLDERLNRIEARINAYEAWPRLTK